MSEAIGQGNAIPRIGLIAIWLSLAISGNYFDVLMLKYLGWYAAGMYAMWEMRND